MKIRYLLFSFILFSYKVSAQDTLQLSLEDAQNKFIKNNYQLIAQKYNIEVNKAQIIQAKLFTNPNIYIEQGLINKSVKANDQLLGPYAQRAIQVQQLILLAGKRNKNINIAEINTTISEYDFFDLTRTLSYSLSSNFFELAFQLKTLKIFNEEIIKIEKIVSAYKELQKDGNAALKDVVRLESFLFSLQSDRNVLELAIEQNQVDLRILLGIGTNTFLIPLINEEILETVNVKSYPINELINDAQENRYDLKIQKQNIHLANTNLKLQKAYKVPDVTLGYSYDRAGSYTNNYQAITLQANLPFFNRNQGNIMAANYLLKNSQNALDQTQMTLNNDVILAYTQAIKTENLYMNTDKQFVKAFNQLIEGVIQGYERKTISLVEFMDFFDSYKQNVVQLNNLKNNRIQSYLKINYSIGKNILVF
jgi:cobalt-zinc-cadmium efflux system outer membrane protein